MAEDRSAARGHKMSPVHVPSAASTPSRQNQATPTTEANMERPKALDSLARQEPCVVLSSTTDPRAGEVEHLILMVEERDTILAYIEQLEAEVERGS